jgi:hypothetical protein
MRFFRRAVQKMGTLLPSRRRRRDNLPSERDVLRGIWKIYANSYPNADLTRNDPYLQIDVKAVAERLRCSPELLFGYLYYYLDHKYRYQVGENTWTHLFALKVANRMHCVNYPYLAGVLSAQDLEHARNTWAIWTSIAALILSLASIIAQIASTSATT